MTHFTPCNWYEAYPNLTPQRMCCVCTPSFCALRVWMECMWNVLSVFTEIGLGKIYRKCIKGMDWLLLCCEGISNLKNQPNARLAAVAFCIVLTRPLYVWWFVSGSWFETFNYKRTPNTMVNSRLPLASKPSTQPDTQDVLNRSPSAHAVATTIEFCVY